MYLFMDCETAETPKREDGQLDVKNGQAYDLGLAVIDDDGELLEEVSLVNEDVFFGCLNLCSLPTTQTRCPNILRICGWVATR